VAFGPGYEPIPVGQLDLHHMLAQHSASPDNVDADVAVTSRAPA